MNKTEDMRYVVDLVARINTLEKDGKKLSASFFDGDYSLWAMQQYFFIGQIRTTAGHRILIHILRHGNHAGAS